MKSFKRSFKIILSIILVQAAVSPAYAAKKSTKSARASSSSALTITPAMLRTTILRNNVSVLSRMNSVLQAKQQVNIARASLLPSLNLGILLKDPVSFLLSTVQVLLPFLAPSNWANLETKKRELIAETEAVTLVRLNTYASAYALAATLSGDRELETVYEAQLADQRRIEAAVRDRFEVGAASDGEVARASAQRNLASVQLSQVRALIAQETAALREMLSMPLEATFRFQDFNVAKSHAEGRSPSAVLSEALEKSPEIRQINALIAAADKKTKGASFAFIGTSSLSGAAVGGDSAFSNLQGGASVNLNFGIFPTVQLAKLQTGALELQRLQIRNDQARLLEIGIKTAKEFNQQYEQASAAQNSFQRAFRSETEAYRQGSSDLQTLLLLRGNVTQAAVARIKARNDLRNIRINLHRILMTDQFALVPACKLMTGKLPKKIPLEAACEGSGYQFASNEK